jgi:glycine amidinotransferase
MKQIRQTQTRRSETMKKININSEFGPLREVIIGRPLSEDDLVIEWVPGMDEEFAWMKPETFQLVKKGSKLPWAEVMPDLFEKINSQVKYYQDVLRESGVTVHEVPRLEHGDRDYLNPGIEQIFPRDVWCTAGATVIVSSLRMPHKRKQHFTMAPFYTELMQKDACNYLSAPQATTDILSARTHEAEKCSILLDGGDFLVNGKEIYLGQGHGSNALGALCARNILGDEYKVIPLKLHANALHLDCTIALIRPGLGIICRKWLLSDLPDAIKDWTWIEASEEEAAWLGVNGLGLNPETYVFDPYHQRLADELRKHGVKIIEVPYDGPSFLGGSVRCSSQPVYREDL